MSEFRRRLMQSGKDYEIVDHICTDCKQWLDFEYIVNTDTEVDFTLSFGEENKKSTQSGFLAPSAHTPVDSKQATYAVNHGGVIETQLLQFFFWPNLVYGQGGSYINGIVSTPANVRFTAYYVGDTYYVKIGDGSPRGVSAPRNHIHSLRFLIGSNDVVYDRAPLKIHGFRISEKGVDVKNFLPAKVGREYGLWEEIEGRFYPSLGEPFLPPTE